MAKGRVKRGIRKAGGILGLNSLTDLADVAVSSAGANYFANVGASATGIQSQWIRPVMAGLIGYIVSPKRRRNATILGSIIIALSQAGIIGSLGGMTRGIIGGTTNPPRGQQKMSSLNVLGRLP
jgi:hypothetical protein